MIFLVKKMNDFSCEKKNNFFPMEIIQIILDKIVKINDKLHFMMTCKIFYNNLFIHEISALESKKINQSIIEQHKYIHLHKLCIINEKITNIDHLQNLKILYMSNKTLIKQKNIDNLHELTDISVRQNNKIISFNQLKNLKCIEVSKTFPQEGLENLYNIRYFFTIGNKNITKISHMQNLEVIFITSCTNITQKGIDGLKNVKSLHCGYINTIINLNYMINLTKLDIHDNKNIKQEGIDKLINLAHINCNNCPGITDLNCFPKLEKIHIRKNCGVDQKGISKLVNLQSLDCSKNLKIKNINYISKLINLKISGDICGVGQEGISELRNIKSIDCSYNTKINNLNHLQLLEKIIVIGNCGVDQKGISQLKNLKKIFSNLNNKIDHISDGNIESD
jgi:hypothetical protein